MSGPQNAEHDVQKQKLSSGSNYKVIDTGQTAHRSESDHHLSTGWYDDAEENQKAVDCNLNLGSPLVFFNLATVPRIFNHFSTLLIQMKT